ncbi:NAD(P)-binding protein [Aspergillus stella-maris]|uniref:NAD(P)-binding protein n=1 Tax=Aspergillus stella-maris TaxID=1810926 RepID=UPI003CCE0FCB
MSLLNPYATEHSSPQGPGDARPAALHIVQDTGCIGQFQGKTILVTGYSSGIGLETALALHATGADVFITARDEAKGLSALEYVRENSTGKGKIDFIMMDLDSLDSVRNGAKEFLQTSDKLNILVNNAGIMATPYIKTIDGYERQFAVNHLAHFTLAILLLPTLISGSTQDFKSRIIQVSSSSHRYATVDLDDVHYEKRTYDPFKAYGQSKTALIWTANHLDRIYGETGVHALSVHPGGIWSGLSQYLDQSQVEKWKKDREMGKEMKSPAQGAATTVWAAVAPAVLEGKGGIYLAECKVSTSSTMDQFSALDDGYSPHAFDEEKERRLWDLSMEWCGLSQLG